MATISQPPTIRNTQDTKNYGGQKKDHNRQRNLRATSAGTTSYPSSRATTTPRDGARTNMGSIRPPVRHLLNAGGHRIRAYCQSIVDNPHWTSKSSLRFKFTSHAENTLFTDGKSSQRAVLSISVFHSKSIFVCYSN